MSSRSFDWQLVGAGLRRLHWGWLLVSLIPIYGTYYGRAIRWVVFLKPLKANPSTLNVLGATVIGFAAITLFGRPGEFVRPYLIARKEQVPVTSQLAAWVLERIFDLLMALLVFAFALSRVQHSGVKVGPGLAWVLTAGGWVVGFTCLGLLLTVLSMRHFAEPARVWLLRSLERLPFVSAERLRKLEKLAAAFVSGVESTRSDSAMLLVLVYSFLEWFLIALCYWCLAQAFSGLITLGIVDVLIFMGFVSFGAAVQIPGIGGGIQVVAVVVLTELFAIRLELATLFAILTWLITFVVIIPAGLIWALKEGLDWRGLRRIGKEVSS